MGEHERGCEIMRKAMTLNPHRPGGYHFAFFLRHYARDEFVEALAAAQNIDMPDHIWAPYVVALAAGQLGRSREATGRRGSVSRSPLSLPRTNRLCVRPSGDGSGPLRISTAISKDSVKRKHSGCRRLKERHQEPSDENGNAVDCDDDHHHDR